MPQIAPDELDTREGQDLVPVVLAIPPAEGDRLVGDLENARVADGGPGDIGAEVFEGGGPGAGRLDVNAPLQTPHRRIDRPILLFEEPVTMLPEGGLEVIEMHQPTTTRQRRIHSSAQGSAP